MRHGVRGFVDGGLHAEKEKNATTLRRVRDQRRDLIQIFATLWDHSECAKLSPGEAPRNGLTVIFRPSNNMHKRAFNALAYYMNRPCN